MPTTEESVVIARPIKDVWEYLNVPENWPEWESSMLECKQVGEGPIGVGTRLRGVNRVLGRKVEWVSEFTEYDEPHLFKAKSVESKFGFTNSGKLEETDGGTRFTYRLDSETGLGGIWGKIADPIVAKAYSRIVRASLDNLAELLAASG
jgi:uncharacterized membrane protein